jgi:hypothetical protein
VKRLESQITDTNADCYCGKTFAGLVAGAWNPETLTECRFCTKAAIGWRELFATAEREIEQERQENKKMNLQNRLKRMENQIITGDEFCAESCRQHPEIITTHEHDGVPCDVPEWFDKPNVTSQPKKPILDVCPDCGKPTRKQIITLNWVTSTKERYR